MDIAAMSMDLSLVKVRQSVGITIAKKVMDSSETAAAGLLEMAETVFLKQPFSDGIGQNVDTRA
ncbi:MAG: YjfB family protein [Hungatella sp.]|jgi:hypothetical protein|nr:YjfB family protein [Hungatella sp.]